jgi:hypothetical protein
MNLHRYFRGDLNAHDDMGRFDNKDDGILNSELVKKPLPEKITVGILPIINHFKKMNL